MRREIPEETGLASVLFGEMPDGLFLADAPDREAEPENTRIGQPTMILKNFSVELTAKQTKQIDDEWLKATPKQSGVIASLRTRFTGSVGLKKGHINIAIVDANTMADLQKVIDNHQTKEQPENHENKH